MITGTVYTSPNTDCKLHYEGGQMMITMPLTTFELYRYGKRKKFLSEMEKKNGKK